MQGSGIAFRTYVMSSRKKRDINLPAPYLRRLWLDQSRVADPEAYPFCLPFPRGGFDFSFDRARTAPANPRCWKGCSPVTTPAAARAT
jgi:hypothetical protein